MDKDLFQLDRETKQNFLREIIIDGGYDPNTFQNYLNEIKPGGGSNVDLWSLDELIKVVDEFRHQMEKSGFVANNDDQNEEIDPEQAHAEEAIAKKHLEEEKKAENLAKDETQTSKSERKDSKVTAGGSDSAGFKTITRDEVAAMQRASQMERRPSMMEKIKEQMQNIKSDEDNFYKVIQCKDINPTNLNAHSGDIVFSVADPQIIKEGIFSSSYLSFELSTEPFSWKVRRKFSDFVWLRTLLLKSYPNLIVILSNIGINNCAIDILKIPPLPREKGKRRFDEFSNAKRRVLLERFLIDCLEYEEVKADPYFICFLSVDDKSKRWAQIKKDGEKAILQISSELRDYADSSATLVYGSEPIYRKLRRLSKQLITEFEAVSTTIYEMGDCFAHLYKLATAFDNDTVLGQNTKLDHVYLTMNNMMSTWAEEMLSQASIVQSNLCDFFKYSQLQNDSLKEILKFRSENYSDFLKCKKANDAKKERHFVQKEVSKWEISPEVLKEIDGETLLSHKPLAFELMFPKDTWVEHELRNRFAFSNFEVFDKINKTVGRKCKLYISNFMKFAKAQSENLSNIHVRWADVLAHFTDAKASRKLMNSSMNSSIKKANPPTY